jgi:hypothetical protein
LALWTDTVAARLLRHRLAGRPSDLHQRAASTVGVILPSISGSEPATFATARVTLLVLVATVASLVPAHRAARVDPVAALRAD